MEAQKTGQFICALRRQRGLTQQELAERVGVTDKAVSRWERGRGLPDVSLLVPLAKALDVSVTELLVGEPLTGEERVSRSDSAVIEAMRYAGGMGRKTAAMLTGTAGVFLLLLPLFTAGRTVGLRLAGAALLLLSVPLRRRSSRLSEYGRALAERLVRRSAARILSAVFLSAALLLELSPWGAVLRFGRQTEDGAIAFFRETYSYFSLLPVGYGNFFPLLTGLLTALLLLLSLRRLHRDGCRLGSALFLGTVLAAVFSLLPPVLFGTAYLSAVGGGITVCLLLSLLAIVLANR